MGFYIYFFVEVNIKVKFTIIKARNKPFGLFWRSICNYQDCKFHFS